MPHHRAPDKRPDRRLAMIEAAGRLRIPFTTGILVGHRRDAARAGGEPARHPAAASRARPHPGGHRAELPRGARRPDGARARARRGRGDARRSRWRGSSSTPTSRCRRRRTSTPPSAEALLAAGLNDFGGISPGHARLHQPAPPLAAPRRAGRGLRARRVRAAPAARDVRSLRRAPGLPRPGARSPPSRDVRERLVARRRGTVSSRPRRRLRRGRRRRAARARARPRGACDVGVDEAVLLCGARGPALHALVGRGRPPAPRAGRRPRRLRRQPQRQLHQRVRQGLPLLRLLADAAQRRGLLPPRSRRSCGAPSRRRRSARRRSASRRASRRASTRASTSTLVRALKAAAPALHLHAFSPEEVKYAAEQSGVVRFRRVLEELRDAGLGSLPGTSAEVLDDRVRNRIAPGPHHDGRVDRRHHDRARGRPAHDVDPDVRPRRDGRRADAAPRSAALDPARDRAASPSSCRCRSCTRRRR